MSEELKAQLTSLLASIEEEKGVQSRKLHYAGELGWAEVADGHHSMLVALNNLEDAAQSALVMAGRLAELVG